MGAGEMGAGEMSWRNGSRRWEQMKWAGEMGAEQMSFSSRAKFRNVAN